jgi:hypothetical protein
MQPLEHQAALADVMECLLPTAVDEAPISIAAQRRDAPTDAPPTEAARFTVAQRIARHGLSVAAVVLASALFASQIHAMLR